MREVEGLVLDRWQGEEVQMGSIPARDNVRDHSLQSHLCHAHQPHLSSKNMRDAHGCVINDVCQMIRRPAVGLYQDRIFRVGVVRKVECAIHEILMGCSFRLELRGAVGVSATACASAQRGAAHLEPENELLPSCNESPSFILVWRRVLVSSYHSHSRTASGCWLAALHRAWTKVSVCVSILRQSGREGISASGKVHSTKKEILTAMRRSAALVYSSNLSDYGVTGGREGLARREAAFFSQDDLPACTARLTLVYLALHLARFLPMKACLAVLELTLALASAASVRAAHVSLAATRWRPAGSLSGADAPS